MLWYYLLKTFMVFDPFAEEMRRMLTPFEGSGIAVSPQSVAAEAVMPSRLEAVTLNTASGEEM